MLVKHNLALKTESEWIQDMWSSSGQFEDNKENNVISFRNVIGDATNAYGINYSIKKQTNFIFLEVENIGDYPIRLGFTNLKTNSGFKILNPKDKITIVDEFTVIDSNLDDSAMRLNVANQENRKEWHKLRINKFMLCNSKTDLYLYSKNALPQAKQALYPPEGNYKEIYAL